MTSQGHRRRSAASEDTLVPSRTSSEDELGGEDAQVEETATKYMCFLCEKYEDMADLTHCLAGRLFHRQCNAAIRAYKRTLPNDSKAQTEYKHLFVHNPMKWRELVQPFISSSKEDRSEARTETAKMWKQVEMHDQVKADEHLADTMILNKTQFAAYTGFWEQLSQEDALFKFALLLSEQEGKHKENGEEKVAYKGIAKMRARTGTEKRTSYQSINEISEGDFNEKRRRLRVKSPAPHVHHPGPHSVRGSSDRSPSSKQSTRGSQHTQGRSTAGTPTTPRRSGSAEDLPLRMKAPSSLSDTQFMKRQELLTADIDQALQVLTGKKGAVVALNRVIDELDDEAKGSEVHKKSGGIQEKVEAAVKHLVSLGGRVDHTDAAGIVNLESEAAGAAQTAQSVSDMAWEHIEALKYCKCKKKKRDRKEYLANFHQTSKITGWMTTTGFPPKLAKLMSSWIHQLNIIGDGPVLASTDKDFKINSESTSLNEVGLWMDPSKNPCANAIMLATEHVRKESKLLSKLEKAELECIRNPKWPGCFQLFKSAGLDLTKIGEVAPPIADTTPGPYIISSRRWHYRQGVGCSPIVGAGMFVQAEVGTFMIAVIPVAPLLACGIVLADFDAFVKTDTGVTWVAEQAQGYYLPKKAVMFVPYGHAALHIACAKDLDCKDMKCAHLVAYPVLSVPLARSMGEAVWASILQTNENFLKNQSASCYKPPHADLKALAEALKGE